MDVGPLLVGIACRPRDRLSAQRGGWLYQAALIDEPLTDHLIAALPAAEQLATESAVKTWRAVRANQPETASLLARRGDAAIKRLKR